MTRAVLLALVLAGAARAQGPDPALGVWASYGGTFRPSGSPFGLYVEGQVRLHDLAGDLDQTLVRVGPQFSLPDRAATFTVGYLHVYGEVAGVPDRPTNENRLYQEAVVPQRAGPLRFAHRVRFEQRWVSGQPFGTRARYALTATAPVTGDGARRGSLYATGQGELFLRGPARAGRPVYDRVRLSGALGVRVADGLGVQAGPLVQLFQGSTDVQVQLSVQHTVAF